MMQIVTHADEGEPFFQKLTDPRRAEQEKSENYIVLACMLDKLLGGSVEFGGCVHVRKFVFVVKSHRHAKIVLAKKQNIDPRNGRNLRDVFDAGSGPYPQGDNAVIVKISRVA